MKKTLFATLLALVLSVSCMTGTVFAAETNSDVDAVTSVSSLTVTPIGSFGGYGHRVTGTASGSFTVNAPSGASGSAGITLKSDCSSSGAFSYISIQKPDGSYFKNNIYLDGNAEKKLQIYFPKNGTYTIHYNTYTPGSSVHLQCWIYG